MQLMYALVKTENTDYEIKCSGCSKLLLKFEIYFYIENLRFSDVFREYRNGTFVENGLIFQIFDIVKTSSYFLLNFMVKV